MLFYKCGRWNAFFLFSERISSSFFFVFFVAVTDANYSCQPLMIKTRQNSSEKRFGFLSHSIRINRQYLASDFKHNNRIRTVEKRAIWLFVVKMCNFLVCLSLPFADYRQDLKYMFSYSLRELKTNRWKLPIKLFSFIL